MWTSLINIVLVLPLQCLNTTVSIQKKSLHNLLSFKHYVTLSQKYVYSYFHFFLFTVNLYSGIQYPLMNDTIWLFFFFSAPHRLQFVSYQLFKYLTQLPVCILLLILSVITLYKSSPKLYTLNFATDQATEQSYIICSHLGSVCGVYIAGIHCPQSSQRPGEKPDGHAPALPLHTEKVSEQVGNQIEPILGPLGHLLAALKAHYFSSGWHKILLFTLLKHKNEEYVPICKSCGALT